MKQFYAMSAKNNVGRIDIYDDIGFFGTSAAKFAKEFSDLEASCKNIEVHISSNGGSMYDGLAIYNRIRQSKIPVTIHIDGLAASSASLIAMAGDETHMAQNALLMMHMPHTVTFGGKNDHEAALSALEAAEKAILVAYVNKSGKPEDEVRDLLAANGGEGTWFGADEAKEAGFVDKVVKGKKIAAKFDINACAYAVPDEYRDRFEVKEPEQPAETKEIAMSDALKTPEAAKPATIQEIKAACEGCDDSFVLAQVEASATLDRVQASWVKVLAQRVKDAEAKVAQLADEKKLLEDKIEPTGVQPIGPKGDKVEAKIEGDPIALWNDAVDAQKAKGKTTAHAVKAVVGAQPELHKAYIAAYNQKHVA